MAELTEKYAAFSYLDNLLHRLNWAGIPKWQERRRKVEEGTSRIPIHDDIFYFSKKGGKKCELSNKKWIELNSIL